MSPDVSHLHIGHRVAGEGAPLFVAAEIGLNHDGSVERALRLVDAAACAGASAVTLQTIDARGLAAPGAPAPRDAGGASLVDFFHAFELDEAEHARVVARARERGLAVIATPMSEAALDLLERVGVDAYKIASGDITWEGLIRKAAATGRPVLIATDMATLPEAQRALSWATCAGVARVALLHGVSASPVPKGSENLRAIATLGMTCGALIGLSDHGPDGFAAPLAVALGASIYERHLVLAADDDCIDAEVSSTPGELAAIVHAAGRAAAALGTGAKVCLPIERPNREASRRGLYARRRLPAGHVVSVVDVIALRPAVGLGVDRLRDLVGQRLTRDVEGGAPFWASDLPTRETGTAHVA